MDQVDLHLLLRKLGDLVLDRLQRPRHIGLHDQAELLDGALLGELEDVLERDLAARAARQRLGLQAVRALARELPRAALVLDDPHDLPRLGHAVEAEHLHRLPRRSALEAIAREVLHRAHASEMRARHQRVADAQGAALDQDRHHRATAGIELGLDHRARRVRLLVGAQLLEVGDDLDRVEQAA